MKLVGQVIQRGLLNSTPQSIHQGFVHESEAFYLWSMARVEPLFVIQKQTLVRSRSGAESLAQIVPDTCTSSGFTNGSNYLQSVWDKANLDSVCSGKLAFGQP